MKKSIVLLGTLVLAVFLTGCSNGGGSATATLSFANNSAREFTKIGSELFFRDLRPAPTVFQMKLIAAYVTQDIDPITQNNVGMTSMIYLNNDCEDDIMHCDISGGTAEDGAAMSKVVTSYFDFAADSAAVNTALNAQARSMEVGTYKYARLEFCKYNSGNANNIKWADGTQVATGTPQEFKRNSCTVNSVEISPAISVAAGGNITITIGYSLDDAITTGSSCSGDDSAGSGVSKACFTMPTFTPSAS